jgi:hypothetical protein
MVSGAAILSVELTPTRIRSVAQGISVVGGRIGASISAFLFTVLFGAIGKIGTIGLPAACAILGGILTMVTIRKRAGARSKPSNKEDLVVAPASRYAAAATSAAE